MNTRPTIADLLPPKARAWTYASLSLFVPVLSIVAAIMNIYWLTVTAFIIAAATSFAGFQLARSNTPDSGTPPPDLLNEIPAPQV